jgi:hypothetical protein
MVRKGCKACSAKETETIDRLLVLGHGPAFVARHWNVKRHHIKQHRDECLGKGSEWRRVAMKWIHHNTGGEGDAEQ